MAATGELLWVRIDDFETGRLPDVCVLTGKRADANMHVRASTRIGGLWFLLVLGVVPFVIAVAVTRKSVLGLLPVNSKQLSMAATERQRSKRYSSLAVVCMIVGISCGVIFVTTAPSLAILGGLGGLVGAVTCWALAMQAKAEHRLGIELDRTGRDIFVRRAHPALVAAVERARQ